MMFSVMFYFCVSVLTVSFTALSYAVNEGDPTATVGIAVTQGTLQSGLRATVMVSTVNGTAEGEIHSMYI